MFMPSPFFCLLVPASLEPCRHDPERIRSPVAWVVVRFDGPVEGQGQLHSMPKRVKLAKQQKAVNHWAEVDLLSEELDNGTKTSK